MKRYILTVFVVWVAACGSDKEKEACVVDTVEGCEAGQICATVDGEEEGVCVAPVVVAGRVFDAGTDEGIEDATVLVVDANGSPLSNVARTAADGTYEASFPVARTAELAPKSLSVTVRVAASDFVPFPTAPRVAIPVDISTAAEGDGEWRLEGGALDVALTPLPEAEQGGAVVSGVVDGDEPGGVLVAASQGGKAVSTAYTDGLGGFILFNVPAGSTQLLGIKQFMKVTPKTVDVPAGGLDDVVLVGEACDCASVSGSVNLVDAAGGLSTSVILAPTALFDPEERKGEAPAGFRAENITGAFAIDGVPPGDYAVLAAFENDGLVLDPDLSISGTAIQQVTVPEDQAAVVLDGSFKVTGALEVVQPGADGVDEVDAVPVKLEWSDDSSEDGYILRVFDTYGEMLLEQEVPLVTGSDTVSYDWTPTEALEDGMFYQFRAWSYRDGKKGRTHISATEDLKGVFQYVSGAASAE